MPARTITLSEKDWEQVAGLLTKAFNMKTRKDCRTGLYGEAPQWLQRAVTTIRGNS